MSTIAETSANVPKLLRVDANGRLRMPAEGQTTIFVSHSVTGATGTIYTVTVGKTFYLVAAQLAARSQDVSDGWAYIKVDTGATNEEILNLRPGYSTVADAEQGDSDNLSPSVPMPFPAGTTFKVTASAAAVYARGTIMGWEE